MLVGLGFVLAEMGTASLADLAGAPLSSGTAMLLLVGILAKSATLPLYIWLPRAYEAAPAPVCALLSGVAENIGIALFYRLFVATFAVPAGFLPFCAGLALVSSLVAGGIALRAGSMRRLLAYSTVSQLGFILLGFSVGGYYGLAGALLYMAGHAVAKAGLFFAAGSVQDACGTDELDRLGGLARSSPALAVAAAVLAFSVIGLPPMVGFFAKLGVMVGAARAGILPAAGAAVAALFTLLYLGRFYSAVFLGETRVVPSRPVSHLAVALVVLMALVALAGGLGWFLPVRFLGAGAGWLMGGL